MGRVQSKVAIITGAASCPGIGNATAKLLAAEGASVVITDRDDAGLEQCRREIENAGGRVLALKQDVTSEDQWIDVIAQAEAAFGKIDILVNNAGMYIATPSIEDLSLADWNRQLDVNLTGVFLGCKHVIPAMRRAGGGSIINISSVGGLLGVGTGAYGASKAGVRILSKSIGVRYAPEKIRCNSVHPGLIRTNMNEAFFNASPENAASILSHVPMGCRGETSDIANCILYLASEEAGYVTGAEFVIDGGQYAR